MQYGSCRHRMQLLCSVAVSCWNMNSNRSGGRWVSKSEYCFEGNVLCCTKRVILNCKIWMSVFKYLWRRIEERGERDSSCRYAVNKNLLQDKQQFFKWQITEPVRLLTNRGLCRKEYLPKAKFWNICDSLSSDVQESVSSHLWSQLPMKKWLLFLFSYVIE